MDGKKRQHIQTSGINLFLTKLTDQKDKKKGNAFQTRAQHPTRVPQWHCLLHRCRRCSRRYSPSVIGVPFQKCMAGSPVLGGTLFGVGFKENQQENLFFGGP